MVPVRTPWPVCPGFLLFHSFRFLFFFNILSTVCKNDAWSHGTFHRFFTGSRENLKPKTLILASRSHTEKVQSAAHSERCAATGVSVLVSWKISSNKGDFRINDVFSSGQVWAWPPRGRQWHSQLILHHWTYFPVICPEKSLRKKKKS